MKKILLALVIFGLMACETHQDRVNFFVYIKDTRTNLCFAAHGYGQGYTMTNVPCSTEVEKLIEPVPTTDTNRRLF